MVYPGTKNGFEAFQRRTAVDEEDKKAYGMKYEDAWVSPRSFDSREQHAVDVHPDQFGIVRYAYIGTEAKDRPPLTSCSKSRQDRLAARGESDVEGGFLAIEVDSPFRFAGQSGARSTPPWCGRAIP